MYSSICKGNKCVFKTLEISALVQLFVAYEMVYPLTKKHQKIALFAYLHKI